MDFSYINSYFLVYTGTVALGVTMLAVMLLCFVAVTAVLAVVYGLVHAIGWITGAAVKSRPVVSPGPAVLRHSSRTVVVLTPRANPELATSPAQATNTAGPAPLEHAA